MNMKHSVDESTGAHRFLFEPIEVRIEEVEGDDIAEQGGIRFQMLFRKEVEGVGLEKTKVDEFIIYPEAIDWENGGQMKPEYQKKIEEKMERAGLKDQMPVSPPEESNSEEG